MTNLIDEKPAAPTPDENGQGAPAPKQNLAVIADGLSRLDEKELALLDKMVTPETAEILAKAFGDDLLELIGPLYLNDQPDTNGQKEGEGKPAAKSETSKAASQSADEIELRQLIADPRYWRERDPTIIAKVAKGFEKLYPARK